MAMICPAIMRRSGRASVSREVGSEKIMLRTIMLISLERTSWASGMSMSSLQKVGSLIRLSTLLVIGL